MLPYCCSVSVPSWNEKEVVHISVLQEFIVQVIAQLHSLSQWSQNITSIVNRLDKESEYHETKEKFKVNTSVSHEKKWKEKILKEIDNMKISFEEFSNTQSMRIMTELASAQMTLRSEKLEVDGLSNLEKEFTRISILEKKSAIAEATCRDIEHQINGMKLNLSLLSNENRKIKKEIDYKVEGIDRTLDESSKLLWEAYNGLITKLDIAFIASLNKPGQFSHVSEASEQIQFNKEAETSGFHRSSSAQKNNRRPNSAPPRRQQWHSDPKINESTNTKNVCKKKVKEFHPMARAISPRQKQGYARSLYNLDLRTNQKRFGIAQRPHQSRIETNTNTIEDIIQDRRK